MALRADRARHRRRLPRQADQAGDAVLDSCFDAFSAQISLRNLRKLDCYANRYPLRSKTLLAALRAAKSSIPAPVAPAVAAPITACVAAGIAKPVRTAVERRICEIAAAIRGAAAVLAQRFAVGVIDEPVCDLELLSDRKK